VKEIRATIFALQDLPSTDNGARARLLAVAEEMASLLGFPPRLRLDGPIDTASTAISPSSSFRCCARA
jgi:hypothetical protein